MENQITTQDYTAQVVVPLVDLVGAYIEARDTIKKLDEEYEQKAASLKHARDYLKTEIIKTFKERKEFSTRVQGATVSLSVKRTPKIIDEPALIAHLKGIGLERDNIAERVTEVFKDSVLGELAKQAIREDGTVDQSKLPPGVVFQETETITARSNEKKDARKVITSDFVPRQLNK